MKISRIEFENFRNFKDKGAVDFSTDGKATIIYGDNGAGKTTFHQLFRWIIYGKVSFNKTATDKLYNLDFEKNADINSSFDVTGKIDFEHDGVEYSMRRTWTYEKTAFEVKEKRKIFTITKKDENNDWVRIQNPDEFVESILPSGLSEYFFFDGERMIADLSIKGKDSAKSLKNALYLMLDLSVYDKAADFIGETDLKTTVLGTLLMEKTGIGTSSELITAGQRMEQAQNRRDNLENAYNVVSEKIQEKEELVKSISEKIGSAKSQKDYELKRSEYKKFRDNALSFANQEYVNFGEEMVKTFPKFLMSASIERASKTIKDQSQKSTLIKGVNKELVDALMKETHCVCGNPIGEKEKAIIKSLYELLPPKGYDNLYINFTDTARNWGKQYNRERIESYIKKATEFLDTAREMDKNIQIVDEQMRENKQFEDLVIDRAKAEQDIKNLKNDQEKCIGELSVVKKLVKKLEQQINELSQSQRQNAILDEKIDIMTQVKKYFQNLLDEKSSYYSAKLQVAIQDLLDKMLTAKRKVSVSKDFALRVVDSNDDESKSEGQFATVSFAYIGGIFKILKEEEILSNKEYPLVLDAPFSKLGDAPRQKVIDIIPEYAPQIILFSKDDLREAFGDKVGKSYTICANAEQNIAVVKEGCLLWK